MVTVRQILHSILDFIFPRSKEEKLLGKITLEEILEKVVISHPFDDDSITTYFNYKDKAVSQLIWALKYKGRKDIAILFSQALYSNLLEYLSDTAVFSNFTHPIIIPVPLSRKRLRERGYNQTELLAQGLIKLDIAKILRLYSDVLVRTKDTEHQARIRDRKSREENIKGAFSIQNQNKIKGLNIILLDDVITTGSTVREARRVLLEARAKQVLVIALAH